MIREGGLFNCGVTMMNNRSDLAFERSHLVPSQGHMVGKDKAGTLVRIDFLDIKQRVFSKDDCLVPRTLRNHCKSWFLLRMGMATSTVGQVIVPIHSTDQESTAVQQTEQIMS